MFVRIAHLLIETAFGLLVFALLLRFWMQVLRAPFRNPVGQFITAISNWMVLPARRVIPGLMGFDLATALLAWLVEALMLALLLWIRDFSFASVTGTFFGFLFGFAFLELVRLSLYLLIGIVLVQVVISWVNPHAPMAPIFAALTRPFYAVFRRFIPPVGGFDLSPLFVLVIVEVLLIVLDTPDMLQRIARTAM